MARNFDSLSKSHCSGRMVTGPDKMYFLTAVILMFIPEIPFLITVCPLFEEWIKAGIYVISIFLWLSSYVFILITSYTDPGIVPRGAYNESENPFSESHRQPLYKTLEIRGIQYDVKWCETCSIFRPPRANHCGICNNCVEKFDHHCPWVGNCIGRRNYKYFMYFLLTLGATCSWVIGICIANIVIYAHRARLDHPFDSSASIFNKALNESHYLSIIIIVYALGGILFVGSLGGFHCYLIAVAKTTNEHIKKSFRKGNPFNKGFARNCISVFCGPHHPSFYRMTYKEKDIELMSLPPLTATTTTTNNNDNISGINSSSGSNNNNNQNTINNNNNNNSPSSSTTTPSNNHNQQPQHIIVDVPGTSTTTTITNNNNIKDSEIEVQPSPSPPSSSFNSDDDDDDGDEDDDDEGGMNLQEFLKFKSNQKDGDKQQDQNNNSNNDKEEDHK